MNTIETNTNSERVRFLKRFLKSPSVIGSITPSSKYLSKKMVTHEEIKDCESIVELGAGTGVFTKYIFDYKNEKSSVYIFEKDYELSNLLKFKFPNAKFFAEASEIDVLVNKNIIKRPDIIISGIPFTVISKNSRKKILDATYSSLSDNGTFVTFQFSLDMYKELKAKFRKVKLQFVPFNLLPAIIYRCTK